MFQTISWVSLSLVLAGIVVHWIASPSSLLAKRDAPDAGGRPSSGCCVGKLSTLACAVAFGSLVILFVTGFGGRLLLGEAIHGYTLMVHVGLAPVFVISAGVMLVAWSYQCGLNENDRRGLASLLCLRKTAKVDTVNLGWKLTFWLAMALVVPVSLSMVLGMFPIFGTHGQETLLCLHQYSSLALTLAVMIHVYLVIRRKALCS
ncbi:MAG: hypothetical protein QGF29_02675 [Verrucomicrobiota bacterium]|jgi:cytochrome b subunit of formate dehydrogenase|nr:hypothetical protein [Verrucomicrobiota bacterium]